MSTANRLIGRLDRNNELDKIRPCLSGCLMTSPISRWWTDGERVFVYPSFNQVHGATESSVLARLWTLQQA